MARRRESRKYRGWYKISVDTLRGWVKIGLIVAVAVGAYRGYGTLEERYVEGKLARVLLEASDLEASVRAEGGSRTYGGEYRTARDHLEQARAHQKSERFAAGLRSAESARLVFGSILRQLHRLETSGEAHFITVQGGVEYRRGERGDWRSARVRDVLYAGDYVKTARSSEAEIMSIDGTVYSIRPDTVILVGSSSVVDEASERSITLSQGWVDLSTSLARSTVTTPGAKASIERESTAVVAWDERQGVGRFAAYRGSMNVAARGGDSRDLDRLEHVVQRGSRLSATRRLPTAPIPIDPADELTVAMDATDRLVLSWQPVTGADRYALQVARNRLFVHKIIDVDDRAKTEATLGLRGDGAFVWRVAALTEDGVHGPWSDPRRFRITSPEVVSAEAEVATAPAVAAGES